MTFKDAIADNLLTGFGSSDVTVASVIMTLGITFVIALYLFAVYRIITENAFYSKNYNISMVAMSIVTAGIILAMQSSLVISLGMVGALSIVRFRTAIKEPMDLLFLFWSIGTGIICGAGLYKIAVILAVCVTVAIIILKLIPDSNCGQVLFVSATNNIRTEDIEKSIDQSGKIIGVKSRNVTAAGTNVVFDVKVKDAESMVEAINILEGVVSVSLVAHDGEFRG